LLVRSVTLVNAALLDGSRVKFVATATIGTDHVDDRYLAQTGIGFASAAGSNANSVAEYVIAALLELAHRHHYRLRDKTLGVVGVGNVGSKVVRYARALGMRVLENDPPRGLVEPALAADIVTLHVPLDATTQRMLHHDNLRGFTLINTSRGAVVDNAALLQALDGDRIPAAVLDVWEHEPNLLPELLDVVDLGTPHIAGYSFDGKVNGTRLIYAAFCRHFGLPATWRPELPAAPVPVVKYPVTPGEDDEDVLREVIRQVYDITADDARLRRAVREFDRQRTEYPVRREFPHTELILRGASPALQAKATALGFK
jgi:erythronate-4-phosphate dehydrogenase